VVPMNRKRKEDVAKNMTDLIGLTPLVRLNKVMEGRDLEILGKAEFLNPSGSLKDRILLRIINDGMKSGKLRPGMTIIEGTTGNTGISTAMMGAMLGYPVLIVMPEGMSEERKKSVIAYGAKIVTLPGAESDVDLVVKKVEEIVSSEPERYFWVNQFNNMLNVEAHYDTTAPEIWDQTGGNLDAFVASQGTAGTLTGVGRYLKERDPDLKIYAVEPAECPILSKQRWGSHRIEGVGDGFIPSIFDISVLDGVILVSSGEAIRMARRLAREEGLFVGISTGANVVACNKLYDKHPQLKRMVTMLNDNGLRYFTTPLFGEVKEIKIPEREHPINLTVQQGKILSKLEVIE
jgi:cysteine synthase A